jgi:two-component system, NtrC family, sensor histidine kinase HydH
MSRPPVPPPEGGSLAMDRAAARLLEISVTLSEPLQLEEVLKRVRVAIIECLGFDRCGIFVLDEAAGVLRGTCGTDERGELEDISGEVHPLSETERSLVQVALGRIPYFLTDDLQALAWSNGILHYPRMRGVRANACIPLRARGHIVGVLTVDNLLTDRPIPVEALEAAAPFAAQAAIAIDNAMLVDRLEERERERHRLYEASAALASVLDLRELIGLVLRSARDLFEFDGCGIWLYEPEEDVLRGQYALLPTDELIDMRHDVFPMGDRKGQMSSVVAGRRPFFLIQDMHSLPLEDRKGVPLSVRAQVIVPLFSRGRILGALTGCTLTPERGIPEVVVEPLSVFASQAAVAIENARLHEAVSGERQRLETAFTIAQERLMESTRLATIGELAAIIAHQLRNPLNVLQTNRHLLQRTIGGTHPRADASLERMAEYIDRATRIINDLLAFAQEGRLNPQTLCLGLLLREVAEEVNVPDHTTIIIETVDPLLIVEADALQLPQALRNLVQNGLQAMPEGGLLTLGAATAGDGVEFVVRDTGVGMTAEQVAHACDPLYTTWSHGAGRTGLGLALVRRVVEAHGGRISLESEPGQGTTVRLWLPVGAAEEPAMLPTAIQRLPNPAA